MALFTDNINQLFLFRILDEVIYTSDTVMSSNVSCTCSKRC